MAVLLPSSAAPVAAAVAGGSLQIHSAASSRFVPPPGGTRKCGGSGSTLSWSREVLAPPRRRISCQASEKEKIDSARKNQMQATELFAELLKADDVRAVAQKHVASLSEDFFVIASTYLDLAKKEGNLEVVNKLETTLQTALSVKEATLRPEIRLLNQLLRQKDEKERSNTIQTNLQYLGPDSYFFQLLGRMIGDVEKQTNNPRRLQLLALLRIISKETKEVNKAAKRSKGFGV